jgi:minor extracellular serine protease Vpr
VSFTSARKFLCAAVVVAGLVSGANSQVSNSPKGLVPLPNTGQTVSGKPRADRQQMQTVFLILAGDPVAVVRARTPGRHLAAASEESIVRTNRAQQDALMPLIQGRGVTILARLQYAINGIKVRGTADQIAELAKLPGVVAVKPVRIYTLNNATSVPFLGTPTVWQGPPALHGEHIKVAVLDTGIDYTHANFGGPGTVAAFTTAAAASTSAADPTMFGPSAPKVKGGTDLVGDNYDAGNPASVPQPDPNPLDCAGHGSHVAGTIAGFGVAGNGTTYAGPYDSTTPSNSFLIGPGVAPLADLYAVRVFGCSGSTNVATEAIDWTVANNMDVINMSLGAIFGSKDSADAVAATNAESAGIIVVAASGNAGNIPYITGSPAAGDKAISVAAMDSHASYPGLNVALSGGSAIVTQNSNSALSDRWYRYAHYGPAQCGRNYLAWLQ